MTGIRSATARASAIGSAGGAGDDWIYSSHGTNTIRAGSGNDVVWAFYGKGTVDCGPGYDIIRIRNSNRYRFRNCEKTVRG